MEVLEVKKLERVNFIREELFCVEINLTLACIEQIYREIFINFSESIKGLEYISKYYQFRV